MNERPPKNGVSKEPVREFGGLAAFRAQLEQQGDAGVRSVDSQRQSSAADLAEQFRKQQQGIRQMQQSDSVSEAAVPGAPEFRSRRVQVQSAEVPSGEVLGGISEVTVSEPAVIADPEVSVSVPEQTSVTESLDEDDIFHYVDFSDKEKRNAAWFDLNQQTAGLLVPIRQKYSDPKSRSTAKYQKIHEIDSQISENLSKLNASCETIAAMQEAGDDLESESSAAALLYDTLVRQYAALEKADAYPDDWVNPESVEAGPDASVAPVEAFTKTKFLNTTAVEKIDELVAEGYDRAEVESVFKNAFEKYDVKFRDNEPEVQVLLDRVMGNIRHADSGVTKTVPAAEIPQPPQPEVAPSAESELVTMYGGKLQAAIKELAGEGYRESELVRRFNTAFNKYQSDRQLSEADLAKRLDLIKTTIRNPKSGVKRVAAVEATPPADVAVAPDRAAEASPIASVVEVAAEAEVAPVADAALAEVSPKNEIDQALDAAKSELIAAGVPESEIDTRIARLKANAEGDSKNKLAPLTVSDIERFAFNVAHDPTGEWNAPESASAKSLTPEKPATKRDKKAARLEGKDLTRLADRLENQGGSDEDEDIVAREKYRNQVAAEAAARREANPIRSQEELYTEIAVAAETLPVGDPARAKLEALQQTVANLRESDEKIKLWMLAKYQDRFEVLTEASVEESQQKEKQTSIENADPFDELLSQIPALGLVQGKSGLFTTEELTATIEGVRAGKLPINAVTRAFGLRAAVERLLSQSSPEQASSPKVETVTKLGKKALTDFIDSPFTSEEEKTTARTLFENSVRMNQEGKDPTAMLKSLEDFITNAPSLDDVAKRMQRGKAYVEASAFNPESRARAAELYATYEALAAGDQNDPEYLQKVQSAYEDYGKYVSEVQITPYEASRREWKESFREHQAKKQAYHDALKQHNDSISKLARLGKMLGMSPKAFEPTPELQAAEEAYKEARKSYAVRLGSVIKERREKLQPDAVPFEQSAVVPKLNAAMARKFWQRPRREQIEITAPKLLSPEKFAKFERIQSFLRRNRTASWLGQVALYGAIGGATGGLSMALSAGGIKGIRLAGSVLAGYGGARVAQELTQRGVDRAGENVKDALGTFSIENIDAHEKNYVEAAVGLENKIRTQKIAKAAAASLAGIGAGIGSGFALSGDVPGMAAVPADAPDSGVSGGGVTGAVENVLPAPVASVEAAVAEPEVGQIYSPRAEQVEVAGVVLPDDPVVPVDNPQPVPELKQPIYSAQAEQTPVDPGIKIDEPDTSTAMFTEEQRAEVEAVEVPIEHDIRRGENVWQVTSFYGDKMLEGLTDRERNQVLMGLRETINSNVDLQRAANITSGDADLVFEGETLKVEPILEALRGEIEKVAPGHLPEVAASEYPLGTPVETTPKPALSFSDSITEGQTPAGTEFVGNTPEPLSFGTPDADVASAEAVAASASPEMNKSVLVTDGVVGQVKLAFPSLDAYNDAYTGWVERVQGFDPRASAWGSIFNMSTPSHENAFKFLSGMKLADIDELNAREVPERTAYLTDHNIRPADFTAWSNKLTEWRGEKTITGVQPNATFGSVADKAFTLEQIKKPA